MKVILLEDVKNVGKKGDVVDKNDGYVRNYLLPQKLAVPADAKHLNDLKLQKANDDKLAAEKLADAQAFADELKEQTVELKMKAGAGGKAFGSVSSKEIAQAYKAQFGKEIDKKKLILPEALKSFGTYEVKVKLHPKVTGVLSVHIAEES
ncbi:MAG: 50S ribosomal protein L9 [Lachnospiraceae bacterium]|nr:50S ribosomal protein L9 [Lachnospiraceae bacterium]